MYFTNPDRQFRLSDTLADGEPSTFMERTIAAYDAGLVRDRANSEQFNLSDTIAARNKAIKEATGVELFDPQDMGGSTGAEMGSTDTRDWFAEYEAERKRLAQKYPDKANIIQADKPIRIEDRERYTATVEKEEKARSNYGGPTGTGVIADFAGGMAAVARDPVQAPGFLIGPTGPVRQTMRSIIAMGLKQALVNAGTQAGIEPIIQNYRKRMGDTYGFMDAASNVAMAGAFGFGADVGGRLLYRGIQGSLGRSAVLDQSGGVVGYEGPAAAQVRAEREARAAEIKRNLEALAPDIPERAAAGDVDAQIELLRALKADEDDPALRGTINELTLTDRVDIGIEDGSAERALAQQWRAWTDPNEPAPARVELARKADGPDLNDFSELPKGTDGNQHYRNFEMDGKPVAFRAIDAKDVTTDPATFQFKGGRDAQGASGKLDAVSWDGSIKGKVIVYERADGTLVVADGHDRVKLAQRSPDDVKFDGFVFRDKDGWTAEDVRAQAAKKNIQEGTGDLMDTAAAFRRSPWIVDDRLSIDTDFIANARSLAKLSDEAFDAIGAGRYEPERGVLVGDLVPDAAMHMEALRELDRLNPATEAEARKIIGDMIRKPAEIGDTMRMLGGSTAEPHVLEARTDVLAGVISTLRGEPGYIGDVETQAVSKVITRLAEKPGLVSDTLNQAGRAVAEGQPLERAIDATLRRFEQVIAEAGVKGLADQPVRLASISNALDMSPEARKARAEAMGFDTSRVLYHGTTAEKIFNEFEARADYGGERGVFLSPDVRVANLIAGELRPDNAGGRVIPAYVKGRMADLSNAEHLQAVATNLAKEIGVADDVAIKKIKDKMQEGRLLWDSDAVISAARRAGFDGVELADDAGPSVIVFDPRNIRSVNATFDPAQADSPVLLAALSDVSTGRSMRRDLDALGYYSKALEAAKAIPQAKGTPEQMLAALKKAGVKDAEIEATGLRAFLQAESEWSSDNWLHGSPVKDLKSLQSRQPLDGVGAPIGDKGVYITTKNDTATLHARDGSVYSVQVRGKIASFEHASKFSDADRAAAMKAEGYVGYHETGNHSQAVIFDESNVRIKRASITRDEIVKQLTENRVGVREVVNERRGEDHPAIRTAEDVRDQTRWSSYSLDPSNPTYRETVLHLPDADRPVSFEVYQQRAGVSDAIARQLYDKYVANWPASRRELQTNADFQSGHFSEPNIIGHMMTSLNKHEGRPVFTLDQIQSDWGQKLRDGGVRDEAKIANIRKQIDELEARQNPPLHPAERDFLEAEGFNLNNAMVQLEYRMGKPNATPIMGQTLERLKLRDKEQMADLGRLRAELLTANAATPGNPLVNTTDQWVNTTLRRAIRQAVEADAEFIAIPTGDTVLSYNPGDENGMRQFYGSVNTETHIPGIVPKNLRKLFEKIDKDAATPIYTSKIETPTYGMKGEGFTLFPLTEKVKRSVMEEGQPMFAMRAEADASPARIEELEANLARALDEMLTPPERLDDPIKGAPEQIERLKLELEDELREIMQPAMSQDAPPLKATSAIPNLTDIYQRYLNQGRDAADAVMPGAGRMIDEFVQSNPEIVSRIAEALGAPARRAEAAQMLEQAMPAFQDPRVIDFSKPVLLKPEANARMAEIRKAINETVKMLPPDVRIRVEDNLVFNFGTGDKRLDGLYDGYERLVYVALQSADPVRAVRHEVIHALRQSGLMAEAEFDALYKFSERFGLRKAYGIDTQYKDAYTAAYGTRGNDFVEQLLREETVAFMFADYSLNGRRFGDVAGGGVIDRMIDRVVSFMATLRQVLGGYGFRNVYDVFESIESGAMANRGMRQMEGGNLASVRQPLDMSPEARKARAEQMGFDTSRVWYHGTDEKFDSFDLSKAGKTDWGFMGKGVYMTPQAGIAKRYGKNVGEYYLRGRMADEADDAASSIRRSAWTSAMAEGKQRGLSDNELVAFTKNKVNEALDKAGYSGYFDGDEAIVFDPSNIRSVNAEFDPAQSGSAKLLAMFAGENAKTADIEALAKAKQMDAEGKGRDAIWNETGWFKGVDGKWRFEISDDKASLDLKGAMDDGWEPDQRWPTDHLFNHRDLFAAYPAIRDTGIQYRPFPANLNDAGAAFGQRSNLVSLNSGYRDFANERAMQSFGLHELQHVVQSIEEMARGGNSNKFTKEMLEAERARIAADQSSRPKMDEWTIDNSIAPDDMTDLDLGRSLYRRLAGEAEARLVQKRMSMTPEERRARPPWLDYDVPEADQIVRMANEAIQMSINEKPLARDLSDVQQTRDAADLVGACRA